MFSVKLRLDRIHCHQSNVIFGAHNPYLWTVFFHGDINTFTLGAGNRLATNTPLASTTSRGLFPNDVQTGDDVHIPASLGVHTVILDDGGTGRGVAGVLFVLLDQEQTPGDAIRAGHQALAESADSVLNDYVDYKFPNVTVPTEMEIQQMADMIEADVSNAIKDELSWYHLFLEHDEFLGFGYQLLLYDQLSEVASETPPEQDFTKRIQHAVNDFEIFGRVVVQPFPPPPDPCQRELDVYNAARKTLADIENEIKETQKELQAASPAEKEILKERLDDLRYTDKPQAVAAVASARAAYEACRAPISTTIKDYLDAKEKLAEAREMRNVGRKSNRFHNSVFVAPARTYPPSEERTP